MLVLHRSLLARTREESAAHRTSSAEVHRLHSLGYKEIHLIGQNVNSYRPKSQDGLKLIAAPLRFRRLLRAVATTGVERIKFTTSFPRDFHPDIVSALEEFPNLCDWVHLPVQSGSDRILRADAPRPQLCGLPCDEWKRSSNPRRRLSLTSDIIVGFPGETDEDFGDTMKLVERLLNTTRCSFSSIRSVRNAGSKSLTIRFPKTVKKRRFLELEALQESIQRRVYSDYVGRSVSVLVEKQSARSTEDMTGHSTCQKVVNFRSRGTAAGEIVDIVISEAKPNSLYGELVNA